MPSKHSLPLWLQLTLLLTSVGVLTFLGGILIFELYWAEVLQKVPESTRNLIEQIRPSPGLAFSEQRLSFRPGAVVLLFGGLVILVSSILISRRILAPIAALERSIERISSAELHQPINQNTEFSQMLRQVEHLAQKLEQSEDARRIANAAIAHELRTPLTALRVRVESLEYGVYPLEVGEISKLHPTLDLLERLVEDLQTLSLAEAGELHLEPQQLDLHALLLEVSLELQIEVQVSTNQPVLIQLDPKRMRQVLYNLLENAKRYSGQNPSIKAKLEVQGTQLYFSLADDGTGVPDEQLKNLFTPFYRLEPSRSRAYGGSGLGLAVIQAIITAHSGQISAKKAALGGLEIQMVLPIELRKDKRT